MNLMVWPMKFMSIFLGVAFSGLWRPAMKLCCAICGGFARLTSFGHAVVGHYRAMEAQSMKLFSKQLAELERGLSA